MLLLGSSTTTPSLPQEVVWLLASPNPSSMPDSLCPRFDMHFPHQQHAIWSLEEEHLQRCSVYDRAKIIFTSKFGYVTLLQPNQ
jgi:hypothetical protein